MHFLSSLFKPTADPVATQQVLGWQFLPPNSLYRWSVPFIWRLNGDLKPGHGKGVSQKSYRPRVFRKAIEVDQHSTN
jgi:hypothetical protein